MKLSILIPTLPERSRYLERLRDCLALGEWDLGTEVITHDDERPTIGQKRNELLEEAKGEWSVFLDDDDLVCPDYVILIIKTLIIYNTDSIGYWVRYYEDQQPREFGMHSHRNHCWVSQPSPDGLGMYLRPITHICPVRTSIARQVKFPHQNVAEDVEWSMAVKPLIRSEAFINDLMYHYFFRNKKQAPTDGELTAGRNLAVRLANPPYWAPGQPGDVEVRFA